MILPDAHIADLEKIIDEKEKLTNVGCKRFLLRKMPPTLHRQLKILASSLSINMEDLVLLAIKVYIDIVREYAAKELEESVSYQKRQRQQKEAQASTAAKSL